jgi:tetratricopeptide (TPR) repeat protein
MEVRARVLAEAAAGRELTPGEVSDFWRQRTIDSLVGPGNTLAHLARKALLFWSAEEFGNNHYAQLEREYAWWLRVAPMEAWWLLAFAAAGFVLVRRGRPGADVAALGVVLLAALLVIMFPVSRYRLPVMPFAVVLAGAGVAEALRRVDSAGEPRPASRRRRAVAAGAALAVTVAAFVPVWTDLLGARASPSYLNLATAFRFRGDDASAERILRRSLETEPDDGPVLEELARTLIDRGHATRLDAPVTEAFALLERAERDPRTQHSAAAALIYAWLVRRKPEMSARVITHLAEHRDRIDLRTAIEIEAYRAVLLAMGGGRDEADGALRELARTMPDHPAIPRARRFIENL